MREQFLFRPWTTHERPRCAQIFLFIRNHQKVKFQSFIKYFDWLEERATEQEKTENETEHGTKDDGGIGDQTQTTAANATPTTPLIDADAKNTIKISRKVFSGKQWLTIEDWLECTQPLCRLEIKHEGRIERSHDECVQTIFASPRLGGNILSAGWSQVWILLHFCLFVLVLR